MPQITVPKPNSQPVCPLIIVRAGGLGGGGVDAAVNSAGGPKLRAAREALPEIATGGTVGGYKLNGTRIRTGGVISGYFLFFCRLNRNSHLCRARFSPAVLMGPLMCGLMCVWRVQVQ